MGYDYHNGNAGKCGGCNLLWRIDKDNITDKSPVSLFTCTSGICWNPMVCKRMAGNKGILLKENGQTQFEAVRF